MTDYQTFSGQGSKFEKHMYFRRPATGENPGWIVFAGTNLDRQNDLMRRGFTRMDKYGTIEDMEVQLRRAGRIHPEAQIDPWYPILMHPDGPREFPVEQVLQLRWYKAEHCPVEGTKFPQIGAHSVREYQCPECKVLPFAAIDGMGGIEPLGRHLRIQHGWDRASLVKYGERINIDFDAIYSAIKVDYAFDGAPVKERKASGFGCPDCDWTPKASSKRPALALSLHQKSHEFVM